jgi:hypothetical protein
VMEGPTAILIYLMTIHELMSDDIMHPLRKRAITLLTSGNTTSRTTLEL